jgi:hypothetical protein
MDKNTGFSFSFVIFSQSPEGNGENGQKHGVFIQILFPGLFPYLLFWPLLYIKNKFWEK